MMFEKIMSAPRGAFMQFLLFFLLSHSAAQTSEGPIDFSSCRIMTAASLPELQKVAVGMLSDEILHRTGLSISSSDERSSSDKPVIIAGTFSSLSSHLKDISILTRGRESEGFTVYLDEKSGKNPSLYVVGNDDKGLLYGIGYLLRKMEMRRGEIFIPRDIGVRTHPEYALRGHQLGYRPKTNSYDGFDVKMWEQYIRDLIVFGANAIELVPPNTDDASDSPMFTLPPEKMLVEMIRLLEKYDLQAWIWYPLMHGDYTKKEDIHRSLQENERIFSELPKLDAVFIPGGDPGDAPPKVLFDYLEQKAKVLHRFHPDAEMWVSPQGFDRKWMDEFMELLREEPEWLSGVVHGPQVRMNVDDFRRAVPKRYPIRRYPDITHNYDAQYPVPDWDFAFAATQNRESINPRPVDQTVIFRAPDRKSFKGFITYSEGVNDDVNKMLWSALGWNRDADYMQTLRDYGRYFIGSDVADDFAQGMISLEKNWNGPLVSNSNVDVTHATFQEMEKKATPAMRLNWRFQMALFRSYYDAYNKKRLLYETGLEEEAMDVLREARRIGAAEAIRQAEGRLNEVNTKTVAPDWYLRIHELAASLFNSIRMQKSVNKYFAAGIRRGGNLDLLDHPLNNRLWLMDQFERILKLKNEEERLGEIEKIVNWTNPGPGGFYDDLGDAGNQPHLVREVKYQADPSFLSSPFAGFTIGEEVKNWRISWARYAQTLYEYPMHMAYDDLDPEAVYQVRITYVKDLYSGEQKVKLVTGDGIEIHPYIDKPMPVTPLVFDIPQQATKDGKLNLRWKSEEGTGGTGRGCQVAEVWLMKK